MLWIKRISCNKGRLKNNLTSTRLDGTADSLYAWRIHCKNTNESNEERDDHEGISKSKSRSPQRLGIRDNVGQGAGNDFVYLFHCHNIITRIYAFTISNGQFQKYPLIMKHDWQLTSRSWMVRLHSWQQPATQWDAHSFCVLHIRLQWKRHNEWKWVYYVQVEKNLRG